MFISHAQKYQFVPVLLSSIKAHVEREEEERGGGDQEKVFVWLDFFSIRQQDTPENINKDVQRIGEIVEEIDNTVVVFSPWNNPLVLTRAWCVYEVLHTQKAALGRIKREEGKEEEKEEEKKKREEGSLEWSS